MLGRKFSREHKRKLSEAHKGKKHSKETKEKIGRANKGKILSNYFLGGRCGKFIPGEMAKPKMKALKDLVRNKKFQKSEKKVPTWKLQAEEMSKYFGKPIYFLFWRYSKQLIYEGFRECQQRRIKEIRYLIGILKKNENTN